MRLAVVLDTDYRSEGSYALDTEAETATAVAEEVAKINSGALAPYGIIAYVPCGHDDHDAECPHARQLDSLWGVVAAAGAEGDYEDYGELARRVNDGYLTDQARNVWESGEFALESE